MSAQIRLIKFGFIFLAFLLGVVLFMWPSPNDDRLEIGTASIETQVKGTTLTDVGGTSILEPRFTGEDNQGRTWHLEASLAQQKGGLKTESISLSDVVAQAAFQDGVSISFVAGSGEYIRSSSRLLLEQGVQIQGYGFILKTNALRGDLTNRTVDSDEHVYFSSPEMFMEAGGLHLDGYGEKMVLSGGVKGRLYSEKVVEPHNNIKDGM